MIVRVVFSLSGILNLWSFVSIHSLKMAFWSQSM